MALRRLGSLASLVVGIVLTCGSVASAAPFGMSYGGRLTTASGTPVAGPVDLAVAFFDRAKDGNALRSAPLALKNVALVGGVFQVDLPLTPGELSQIFADGQDVFIEVTDVTHGKTYPRQRFSAVPYALRVPTDGKTVTFNADGALSLALPAGGDATQYLTVDGSGKLAWQPAPAGGAQSMTSLGIGTTSPESTLDVNGAVSVRGATGQAVSPVGQGRLYFDRSAGRFLVSENGGAYQPLGSGGGGGGSGSVTSVTAGTGLAGGTITGAGTISLATVGTTGAFAKVTVDAYGRVVSGGSLAAADVPALDAAKITTGTFQAAQIPALSAAQITSGTLAPAQLPALSEGQITSGTLAVALGGTGATSFTNNGVVVGSGVGPLSATAAGTQYQVLTVDAAGQPVFGVVSLDQSAAVSGTLPVANGGTGSNATLVGNRLLMSSGSAMVEAPLLSLVGGNLGVGTTSASSVLDVAGAFSERAMTAPPLAPAGQGRIYFDATSNQFMVSQNGGAYAPLGTVTGGTITQISAGTGLSGGGTSGNVPLALATVGTGGSYAKVYTDAYGRVTGGGSLASADLPSVPAGLVTGTFGVGAIPSLPASQIVSGTFAVAQIPALPASQITSGTLGLAQLPSIPASSLTGALPAAQVSGTLAAGQIPALSANQITSGTLALAQIPSIPASNVTGTLAAAQVSGTLAVAQIPGLPASQITSGTFTLAQIPSLSATQLTTGTLAVALGGTGATSFTNNGVLVGSGAGPLSATTAGAQYQVLTVNGSGNPVFGPLNLNQSAAVSGTLAVANGGTGASSAAAAAVFAGPTGSAGAPSFRALVGSDLPLFGASGASHAAGAVPDPGASAGSTRYLREDGSWSAVTSSATPAGANTQVQFNSSGGLGADGNFVWDNTNKRLGIGLASPGGVLDVKGPVNTDTNQPRFLTGSTTSGDWNEIFLGASVGAYSTSMIRYMNGQGTAANAKLMLLHYGDGQGLTLQGGGYVGVGTYSPMGILHVATPTNTDTGQPRFLSGSSTQGDWNEILLGASANAYDAAYLRYFNGQGTSASSKLQIFNAGDASQLGVTVQGGGFVGIDVAAPSTVLDVGGALTVRGQGSPGVSSAGQGRIYFDNGSNSFLVSQNGGAFSALATGGTITGVTAGTGLTGGGSTGSVTLGLASVGTAGSYTKLWTDAQGRVTAGTTLAGGDIPPHSASLLTSGTVPLAQLPSIPTSQITGTLAAAQVASIPVTQLTGVLTTAQLPSIPTTQVTGTLAAAQVASIPTTQITGTLAGAQLGAHSAALITSGTLAVAQGGTGVTSAAANQVFAAPNGSAGAPGFRSLVAADYPAMVGDAGSGGTQGAVPAPPAGSAGNGKFLKADGTWATPASGVTAAIAPSFFAYLSASVTAGVNIKVPINTVSFDTNNNFNTTTNRYTPTVAGKYLFRSQVLCPSSVGQSLIYKNGGNQIYGQISQSGDRANAQVILDMNGTTDYAEAYGYCTSGTSDTFAGGSLNTNFSGALLAPLASGSVAGTGTANTVPMWSNSTNVTNSPISVSGSFVGIGTTGPGAPLHVKGQQAQGVFEATSGNSTVVELKDAAATPNRWQLVNGVGTTTDGKFSIYDARQGQHRLVVDTNGYVGINTQIPGYPLQVNSNTTTDPYLQAYFSGTGGFGGVGINGSTQSHVRFFLNGTEKWQMRVGQGAGTDAMSIYSWTSGTDVMYFANNGDVGVGIVPASRFHILSNGGWSGGLQIECKPGAGSCAGNSWGMVMGQDNQFYFGYGAPGSNASVSYIDTSGTYHQLSDERLKTNVETLTDPLATIMDLRGVRYEWKDKALHGDRPQLGVIAQEVEKIVPEAVSTAMDGTKTVSYTMLVPLLLEGTKDLKRQLDAKSDELATLKAYLCARDPEAPFCAKGPESPAVP